MIPHHSYFHFTSKTSHMTSSPSKMPISRSRLVAQGCAGSKTLEHHEIVCERHLPSEIVESWT
jgi:hypothetical protein